MNVAQMYQILLGPLTTEKNVRVAEQHNQFVFKVAKTATRTEIKEAVQKIFNVVVTAVNISNMPGKTKRFKQKMGRKPGFKKAFVSLAEGHDINWSQFE